MQIYVDPSYPAEALEDVQMQLKMLRCLLSQGGKAGIDLDEDAAVSVCSVLSACADAIEEAADLTRPVLAGRGAR